MILQFREAIEYLKKQINLFYLFLSFLFLLLSLVFTSLHYKELFYGNSMTWIFWLASLLFLLFSFVPSKIQIHKPNFGKPSPELILIIFVIILYAFSHLWNFSIAPWNQYGLFDDAAWDIYFAKNHVFNGSSFQPAYFDTVGYISREVVFHYYISMFFKLFGYNLLTFNFSLIVLGEITVLFTSLIVQKLFGNLNLSILSALIINFFPLHYTHIFMGHRYAIAAPLMVVSLYFLYSSFKDRSFIKAVVSSIFAAFCLGSAVMGKQYVYALLLAVIFSIIFRRIRISKEQLAAILVWVVGFIFAAMPLLLYIAFNYRDYTLREKNLIAEFLFDVKTSGLAGIVTYSGLLKELFFAKFTYRRQFLPDNYIIPLIYYLFLLPGLLLALIKKRFEIFFISIIPALGAFVSGAYDFRVLISVPTWVIAISFTINLLFQKYKKGDVKLWIALAPLIIFGLLSSISYLWKVSKDTHHFYLLPHKDVAVSRLMQDLAAGSESPNINLKKNEFRRQISASKPSYDTLICPFNSYAIAHLYLQDFDDKKVLSFCNQGIQLLKTPEEILSDNIAAITNYVPNGKDLLLIWEGSDKSQGVIESFKKYEAYGSDKTYSGTIEGLSYSLYTLKIENRNLDSFKSDVSRDFKVPGEKSSNI